MYSTDGLAQRELSWLLLSEMKTQQGETRDDFGATYTGNAVCRDSCLW